MESSLEYYKPAKKIVRRDCSQINTSKSLGDVSNGKIEKENLTWEQWVKRNISKGYLPFDQLIELYDSDFDVGGFIDGFDENTYDEIINIYNNIETDWSNLQTEKLNIEEYQRELKEVLEGDNNKDTIESIEDSIKDSQKLIDEYQMYINRNIKLLKDYGFKTTPPIGSNVVTRVPKIPVDDEPPIKEGKQEIEEEKPKKKKVVVKNPKKSPSEKPSSKKSPSEKLLITIPNVEQDIFGDSFSFKKVDELARETSCYSKMLEEAELRSSEEGNYEETVLYLKKEWFSVLMENASNSFNSVRQDKDGRFVKVYPQMYRSKAKRLLEERGLLLFDYKELKARRERKERMKAELKDFIVKPKIKRSREKPESVRSNIRKKIRTENQIISDFIENKLITSPNKKWKSSELYKILCQWYLHKYEEEIPFTVISWGRIIKKYLKTKREKTCTFIYDIDVIS